MKNLRSASQGFNFTGSYKKKKSVVATLNHATF